MRGLLVHLGHPNGILLRVKVFQAGSFFIQLIAQHQHQVSERCCGQSQNLGVHVDGEAGSLRWRQASEQYSTCSQFLAQALRQVISRAHTLHGLLGKLRLLPLNDGCVGTREKRFTALKTVERPKRPCNPCPRW